MLEELRDELKENRLQRIFDEWGDAGLRRVSAGAPHWIAHGRPSAAPVEKTGPRDLRTDSMWECGTPGTADYEVRVVELKKISGKGLHHAALAQVLDYANALVLSDGTQPRPAIISGYDSKLRGAVAYLSQRGVKVDAVEVDVLRNGLEEILWFDVPIERWEEANRLPTAIPSCLLDGRCDWKYVPATKTWIATDSVTARQERPLIVEGPCAMLAELGDSSSRSILWWGKSAPDHLPDLGTFFVYEESTSEWEPGGPNFPCPFVKSD